jgi:hypothetical protein
MSRQRETNPDNLPEGPFNVIPGVGIVRVVRKKVSILEHIARRGGFPCPEAFGMEVELLRGGDINLVCSRCFRGGVIEDVGEE